MPSYTTSLRLIQPATGEYSGTWGTQVNNGITALVDAAVAGTASITMTAANYTLSNNNGASDEARAMFLVLQGTPGASYFVIVPTVSKLYFVTNNTGFAQRISTSTTPGSGISVPNGASMTLRCDGTNVVQALTTFGNLTYTGTLTGSTGILDIGSGQIYKDGSGNVGIGTSSPASKLDVSGAFGTSTTAATITNTTGFSASNIARIDFKLNNSFGGLERTAAIWSVNPNAGANNGGALVFGVSANGTATTPGEVARFDSSGNLGLGVTPSAWVGTKAIDISNAGSFYGDGSSYDWNAGVALNAYQGTSGTWRYKASSVGASRYNLFYNEHRWFTSTDPTPTAGNAISFTQAMTLDASGNLGVGTTSVPQRLTIEGSAQINSSGTFYLNNSDNTNQYYWQNIGATGANNATLILSRTNAGETLRITSGGDFGINGTPPTDSQFYSKNSATNKFAGTFENHDAGGYGISIGTANTNLAFFYPNASRTGSPVGAITTNGSSTSYVTSSDRRLKEGIAPAADAGPIIDAIEVVQHEWKVGGHTRYGVIAQDLNAVAPEAVSAGDDGDEIEKAWGVDYSKLVPMLIKEIQSLRARVAALEAQP